MVVMATTNHLQSSAHREMMVRLQREEELKINANSPPGLSFFLSFLMSFCLS